MDKYTVGIIGNGFVGGAIAHGFSAASTGNCDIHIYDIDPLKAMNTLDETVNGSDFVFVCVPTPMNKDGSINLDIVRSAVASINEVSHNKDLIVILKSTIVPGTTESISEEFPNLNFVFSPEFLTERQARLDFINQSRVVFGGHKEHTSKVADLFRFRFKYVHVIETDFKTAELIKYFANIFFATKVSFANEMKQLCDKAGADWNTLLEGAVADGRIADAHLNVPGPDGKMGFGGSCFPKDINALITFADELGVNLNVIKGAWKTNLEVRPEEDWKELKGRAVVDD